MYPYFCAFMVVLKLCTAVVDLSWCVAAIDAVSFLCPYKVASSRFSFVYCLHRFQFEPVVSMSALLQFLRFLYTGRTGVMDPLTALDVLSLTRGEPGSGGT